jgi:hypothetical protein
MVEPKDGPRTGSVGAIEGYAIARIAVSFEDLKSVRSGPKSRRLDIMAAQ